MEPDLRLLRSFVALAGDLHFGRAASALHVSQPTLSSQIRRLEEQLGTPLFTRSTRNVELTAAGRALIDPARSALRSADQGFRAARAVTEDRPPLHVGVEIDLDDGLDMVRRFVGRAPEVLVMLSREHEPSGHKRVREGSLDVFVGWIDPQDEELASASVAQIPLLAVLHPTHRLADAETIALADFRRSTIAIFRDADAPESFVYFTRLLSGDRPEDLSVLGVSSQHTSSHEAMMEAVRGDEVVSFGAGEQARRMARTAGLRVCSFEPPLTLPSFMSWRRADPPSALDQLVEAGRHEVDAAPVSVTRS